MQDFAALAAIEEQALAARGGGGGVIEGRGATEKPSNDAADANGRKTVAADGRSSLAFVASSFSAPSHPQQAVVDLTVDSPRENRAPFGVSAANEETGKQKAGETVVTNIVAAKAATATTAAAPAVPPPPPPPVRHLTLADVSKPPDLVALPWLNAEIKLDR